MIARASLAVALVPLAALACGETDGVATSPMTRPAFQPTTANTFEPGDQPPQAQPGAPLSIPPFGAPTVEPQVPDLLYVLSRACGGEMCVQVDYIGLPPGIAPADCTLVDYQPKDEVVVDGVVTVWLDCTSVTSSAPPSEPPPEPPTSEGGGG